MNYHLLDKYNIPAPRYTSFPTVPYWNEPAMDQDIWLKKIKDAFDQSSEISLYIHLPYCERLCTYCGCNKHITRNHEVELPYIESVLAEWRMYRATLGGKPILRELHLGGGTPTFFSAANLTYLIESILSDVIVPSDTEYGFEAHPFSTGYDQLIALRNLGFNRISVGVQDFAPEILAIINRQQTENQVRQVTEWARALGYVSVNYDLIFGLPLQTPDHIDTTMAKVAELCPDRIAFYSYAHVPWIKPSQRAYSEADLPQGEAKRALYERGRTLLEAHGYLEIGLDHFSLPNDSLYKAQQNGVLHRNFMGYTPHNTQLCLALGASGISDTWDAYVQNEKTIADYKARIAAGELPLTKGHLLSEEDLILRKHILALMCQGVTSWEYPADQCDAVFDGLERLSEMESDGLVKMTSSTLTITGEGKPFVRNICLAFDAPYWRSQPAQQLFSKVI